MSFSKDQSLDDLARVGNVAQFVSFLPGGKAPYQRYSRVADYDPNHVFPSTRDALRSLLTKSPEGTIESTNFRPDSPPSRDFYYGLDNIDTAETIATRLLNEGLFVIANETVDVSDGGVSGVIQAGVTEFAPDDTPRCVERRAPHRCPRSGRGR